MYFRVGPAASTLGYLRRALNRGAQRPIANNVILRDEANKSFVINGTMIPLRRTAAGRTPTVSDRDSFQECGQPSHRWEALAAEVQSVDLQNEACVQVLDWKQSP
jgi:hypothetical protein